MKSNALSSLPVPYFLIDGSHRILYRSAVAESLFPQADSLLDIVDSDSKTKLKQLVKPWQETTVEIHLLSGDQLPVLYELFQQWEDKETGHVVAIRQQNRINTLQQTMEELREGFSRMAPSGLQVTSISSEASRKRAKLHLEASSALETIDDLMIILRADFIELGKTTYSDVISEKVHELRELLHQFKDNK